MRNKLSTETSPYLRQHADQPVDWWPWNDKALQRARETGKPILLSIGYSACHWCHTMAHESFEDAETAELMNRLFINIKVDREERPDLDQIFQAAHLQLTHRNGGWPLTMALTPDGIPFFAGTYFPKAASDGHPAFCDVLRQLARRYSENASQITEMGTSIIEGISQSLSGPAGIVSENAENIHQSCIAALLAQHDTRFGGFYEAPKFPHPTALSLLSRAADTQRNEAAHSAVLLSLRRMASGGLYDHIGGGFSRYCVDARWLTPHFEKMLSDNALLLSLYASAWTSTGDEQFKSVVVETARWLTRKMQEPDGGFHASIDADSEGMEGSYYLWDRQDIERLLKAEQLALVMAHYGLNEPPNFEQRRWHLHISQPLDEVAHALAIPPQTARMHIDDARRKLFAVREMRQAPQHDKKILVAWNAFAITALAKAANSLQRPDFLRAAQLSMDSIRNNLWQEDRLLTAWCEGSARIPAYLDDYAALIQACLVLMSTEFRVEDLDFAIRLADRLLDHFQDHTHGGFYFTADDAETVLLRFKPWHDGATPSGNGLAAQALLHLGEVSAELRFVDAAKRSLEHFLPHMQAHPAAVASLALALDDTLRPPQIVVIDGGSFEERQRWQKEVQALPGRSGRLVIAAPIQANALPPELRLSPPHGTTAAKLCQNQRCLATFDTLEALSKTLLAERD